MICDTTRWSWITAWAIWACHWRHHAWVTTWISLTLKMDWGLTPFFKPNAFQLLFAFEQLKKKKKNHGGLAALYHKVIKVLLLFLQLKKRKENSFSFHAGSTIFLRSSSCVIDTNVSHHFVSSILSTKVRNEITRKKKEMSTFPISRDYAHWQGNEIEFGANCCLSPRYPKANISNRKDGQVLHKILPQSKMGRIYLCICCTMRKALELKKQTGIFEKTKLHKNLWFDNVVGQIISQEREK